MSNAGKVVRICTLCDTLSPYDARYCVGCGRYLPVEGPTQRLPAEGPTENLLPGDTNITVSTIMKTGDMSDTSMSVGSMNHSSYSYPSGGGVSGIRMQYVGYGESNMHWFESFLLVPDAEGNLTARPVRFGIRDLNLLDLL